MINPAHTGKSHRYLRPGFTLVELLISITIIIVLAALVLAMTRKIRANAQQANAVSVMRQIATANVAYYTENNGAINVIRDPGEWGSGFEGAGTIYATNSFVGRMQPYLFAGIDTKTEKILKTQIETAYSRLLGTSDISTMTGTAFSGVPVYKDGSGIGNPISVNLSLRPAWRQAPLRASSFGNPSSVLYLTFGRYYFDPLQGSAYTPMPIAGDRRRAIYYLPNHKGIFSYLDGHVDLLAPPIPERLFGTADT